MTERSIVVRLKAQVAGYKTAIADAEKATNRAAASIDRDGKKIDTAAGRMVRSAEVNREAWDKAGLAVTAFAGGTAAALVASVNAAVDWETAWTGVLKTVVGSGEEIAKLEEDLRAMTGQVSASHTVVAAVAEAAGQLGVQVDNVAAFTRVMVDLGETTNLTAEEAATALARIANIMGTTAGDVSRMGATIVGLGNNAATTEAEIVGLATRLAAAGKQAGLSEADIFAFASALTSVGVEAEAGGTAVSKVMTSIGDAVRDGGDNLKVFASVAGVSVNEFSAAFREDGADAIGMFIEGMGRMSAEGKSTTAVFDELGLADERLKRSVLSLGSATGLLGDQLELANEEWDSNRALIEEAAKRYDTTEAKIQIAKNSINDAAITIGDTFLPAIALMADGVSNAAQAFAGLPGPVQNAVGGLGAVVAVGGLAAGSFLLLAPRLLETASQMRDLGAISPRAARGIGRLARSAAALGGTATAVAAFAAAVNALNDAQVNTDYEVGGTTSALLDVADGVATIDQALADSDLFSGGQGWIDWLTGNTNDIHSFADALNVARMESDGFWDQVSSGASGASVEQARVVFEAIDESLAGLVSSGNAGRAEEVIANLGLTVDDVTHLLPSYNDALADVDNQQRLAAEGAATTADSLSMMAAEQEEALKQLDEWRRGVSDASSAFIDVERAYGDVIEANKEVARSTAEATESAEDSWEDFYDGSSVSIDSYIAKLDEQVKAQASWQDNILGIAERVNDDLPSELAGAGQILVDELLALGPEGAALVQAISDASTEEFEEIVTLYGQKGEEASGAFVAEVESILPPSIAVDADITPAQQKLNTLKDQLARNGYTGPVAFGDTSATTEPLKGFATGGISATPAIFGEGRGREAAVPLDLPLGQVDPSVRGLAAYARSSGTSQGHYGVAPEPQVITVPVESRYETHAPVSVYTSASTIEGIQSDVRMKSWGGRR